MIGEHLEIDLVYSSEGLAVLLDEALDLEIGLLLIELLDSCS